ncbi:MAG: hypothetical protein ACI4ME_08525 [Aristaeellaceae bacterium]
MIEKLLTCFENRFGRYHGFRNLIQFIVAATAAVYVSDLVLGSTMGFYLSEYLAFNRGAILRGQIWRVFTFVITPPSTSILFILMELGFLYFTGTMLQSRWGTLRFNLFYFTGMLGSVIAGFITGYATTYYLNLSMMLAVAILYPMMQVNLYGILPLRMKWLALLDVVLLLPGLINGSWGERIAILISLLNVLLFFFDRLLDQLKDAKRRYEWKKNWRKGSWR